MKSQSLQRQFSLWTVLLVVVPSLMIMVIYSVSQIKAAKQQNLELINQRVHALKRLIDYWTAERADYIRRLSQSEAFRTLDNEQMKRALNLAQRGEKNFDSLSYIGKDGFFKISTLSTGIRHPSAIGKPYFEEARAGKEYISNVVIGRNSGQPITNFSSPVYDYAGNFQGLILGSVRTSTLETLLPVNEIGQTGEVFLVNREGIMLTELRHVNILIDKGLVEDTARMNFKITNDAFRQIRLGESGTATWIDYLGNKVLGAYLDVPERGWTIIGKINEAEVLAPIYTQLAMMAGGTIFFLLLILPLASRINNRVKLPIEWLIRQSNLVTMEDYAMVGQDKYVGNVPYELGILCDTFIKMSRTIQNTIDLLKERDIKLENKVREIESVNAALKEEIKERKQAEERYQFLFNSINDVVLVYPLDSAGNPGKFSEVNNIACQRLGYTKEEFYQINLIDINPSVTVLFQGLRKHGKLLLETSHVSKTGREIPVEVNISVLSVEGQDQIVSIARDISRRKAAESALRRKLDLEEILAQISGIFVSCPTEHIDKKIDDVLQIVGEFIGVDHSFIFPSNTAGTTCNLSYFWCKEDDGQFAGLPKFSNANHVWEREQISLGQNLAVASAADLPVEDENTKKMMETFGWKSLLVLPMVYMGRNLGFFGLATVHGFKTWDKEQTAWLHIITELIIHSLERKRTHDALCLREAENQAIFAAVPDLFMEIDMEGIVRAARGPQSIYLVPPEEWVGKSLLAILPPRLAQTFFDNIQAVIRTKAIRDFEYDITINNETLLREARVVTYKDDQALVVIRDITEKKRAECKIKEAALLMEQGQRWASLGIMATSIAHEINQPLNAIQVSASGVVYALDNGVKRTKGDMLKEFALISEQADRIAAIINNIRMFIKNDYSLCQLVNLSSVIEQARKTVSGQPLFQHISLKVQIDDNLPPVMANDLHLQQAVTNLLINAAQALSARPRNQKIIEIKAWLEEHVIMEVRDNGLGFSEGMAAKIFEPLYTGKTGDQTMGLGLTIVRTIINSYGGKVSAYSNDAEGATFRIEFPKQH